MKPLAFLIPVLFVAACATTSVNRESGQARIPVLPDGQGKLILESGGIESLSFSVIEQATGRKIVDRNGLEAILPEGVYKLVVKTGLDQPLVVNDATVVAGEERPIHIPVGMFMVNATMVEAGDQPPRRIDMARFTVYEYDSDRIVGKGVASWTSIQRFIAPVGTYKIGVYLPGQGEQKKVYEIQFGRPCVRDFEFQGSSSQTE